VKPRISIVIPTYNHLEDCLIPCIDSIEKYTNSGGIEIIIVSQVTEDEAPYKEYFNSLSPKIFKVLNFKEGLGYTKATNEGLKVAQGEFLIVLNNDIELLPQEKHTWINMLLEPMKDPQVGITGPLVLHDDYADHETIIFFCAMFRKEVLDRVGLLDEIYSPGAGEDIDFSVKASNLGYKIIQVPGPIKGLSGSMNIGDFPIWHKDNQTFKHVDNYSSYIVKRNGLYNCKRHNKHIRLNMGSGGISIPGYLNLDLLDRRAHIIMDATKLDFDDDSIESIAASHLVEHLDPYQLYNIFSNWFRKMKSGGTLIIECPDMMQICREYPTASKAERYNFLNCIYGSINTSEGDPNTILSAHLWGFDAEILYDHVAGVGFVDVRILPEQWPHPGRNMRLEARKP
jgi:GT2 family glycosyltransferase